MATHLPSSPIRRNAVGVYDDLKMAIEYISISEIKPNSSNPHTHDRAQIQQIASSIQAFGVVLPLLVTPAGNLIAGHAVLEALKLLGHDRAPVVRAPHNEPERRGLALALNRLAEKAKWDPKLLKAEFEALLEFDAKFDLSFDLEITGFAHAEIDQIVEENGESAAEEGDIPEVEPGPSISEYGDLFYADDHRILHGDTRRREDYALLMGDKKADFVCADGPYNVPIDGHASGLGRHRHREFPCASGEMSEAQFSDFLSMVFANCAAVSVSPAHHIHFSDWRGMHSMLTAGRSVYSELKNLLIWVKPNGGMGSHWRSRHELLFVWQCGKGSAVNPVQLGKFGRNRTNVLEYPGGSSFHAGRDEELASHPTPKPVALIADLIRDCTNRGQIVLDPFSGSGTSLIAAAKTGRRAFVMELDGGYVDLAIRRWERWSGRKARHAETGLTFDELSDKRLGDRARVDVVEPMEKPPMARVRTRRRSA